MAAINGTALLLYSQGKAIAVQRGVTLNVDVNLEDATNKESAGWAQHLTGLRSVKINFTSLFDTGLMTDTPTILSAKNLMDYIINQTGLIVGIIGGPYPILGEADMSSLSFDAPMENAMTLAGSVTIDGPLYMLSGTMAQMITDPDSGGTDYDTLTVSGTAITSAINASGTVSVRTNNFAATDTKTYKLITYLTNNGGELPSAAFVIGSGTTAYSNVVTFVAGINVLTLVAKATDTMCLRIYNTAATDWEVSSMYLFNVS